MEPMETKEPARRAEWIKKIIAAAILVACMVFICLEKDSFLLINEEELPSMTEQQKEDLYDTEHGKYLRSWQSLKGNVSVEGEFTAAEDRLMYISLYFTNEFTELPSGTVTLTLKDAAGKTVCESTRNADQVSHNRRTTFYFSEAEGHDENWIISSGIQGKIEDQMIRKGETYRVQIRSKDLVTDGNLTLVMFQHRDGRGGTALVNGREDPARDLWMMVDYHQMRWPLFISFLALLFIALILTLLPVSRIEGAWNGRRSGKGKGDISLHRILVTIMFFLTPFVCFAITYKTAGYGFMKILEKLTVMSGMMNLCIILVVWLFFYVVTNRMKYGAILTTLFFGLFSFANYVLIQFRDIPLIAADILSARTAFTVMGSYHLDLDKAGLYTIVISVIWICLALSLNSWKGPRLRYRLIPLLIFMIGACALYGVIFQTDFLKENKIFVSGFKPRVTYNRFGYPLSFLMSVKASIVEKPDGYSAKKAGEIMGKYRSDTKPVAHRTTKETPNIIAIMNESYSDLSLLGDIRVNEDPMPFYRSLKKDTIRGRMHSSVFGSMTANSEFEFLTGFSGAFLPFRAIAYNNMIKEEIPNLNENLKRDGYGGNIAFHPGLRASYNREKVYPLMGFDEHIALEDIEEPQNIRAFVSDEQDYAMVEEQYESYRKTSKDAPFFLFNVTIQNHGGYKRTNGVVREGVEVLDPEAATEEAVQFLNLMKDSDKALKQLIGYFSRVKEPTVIVLFGDHQPNLEKQFYKYVMGKYPGELSGAERELRYQVPFLMWANYDIREEEDLDISANYMAPYLLERIGGRLTAFDKYLLEMRKEIPVITAQGYYDKNKRFYDLDDTGSPYADRIREYQMIQYNGLVDTKNRNDEFFYFDE